MSKGAGIGARILWFFLGIIFAFVAVGGAIAAVTFVHFDTIFGTFKVQNKDDKGEYIYINTGTEGVKNVYELIERIVAMASKPENMTIGQLEKILPVSKGLVDGLVTAVEPYLDMDKDAFREELVGTPVSGLGDYISGVVGNVWVYNVLKEFAPDMMGDDAAGKIIQAIVLGREANYVTVSEGVTAPVYVDVYKEITSGVYQRYLADADGNYTVADQTDETPVVLAPTQASYLEAVYGEEDPATPLYYNLYYYLYDIAGTGEKTAFVTDKDFTHTATVENAAAVAYAYNYDEEKAVCTGKYYKENGAPVIVTPVRLKDLSTSQNLTDSMDNLLLTELMPAENLDETTEKLIGGYTLGDLISGRVNIQEVVDKSEFSLFMKCKPDNTVMVALLYEGVANMRQTGGAWKCDYTDDMGVTYEATVILADDGNIDKIIYGADGENRVPETLVSEIADKVNDLEVAALLDNVSPTDGVMAYICYGITEAERSSANLWTALYNPTDGSPAIPCTVKTVGEGADERITRAYYMEEGQEVSVATTVNGIDARIAQMTKVLKIKDIVAIDEDDKFMRKLGDYTIETVGSAVSDFEVADMLDVTPTDALMTYVGYGIKNAKAVSGQPYQYVAKYTDYGVTPAETYDVYVVTKTVDDGNGGTKEVVDKAYYLNGSDEVLLGTKVNQVTARMENFSKDLTLVDILGAEALEENKTLKALQNSTLERLTDDIKTLPMQSLYFADIYGVAADADPTLATTFNENYLYYKLVDGVFVLVHDEKEIHQRGKLTEAEFNATPKTDYYTYGELKGTWKYMLTCTDGLVTGEEVYTVNDISDLSSNVLTNVKSATLRDLKSTGVVDITEDTLNSELLVPVNGKTIMGDLTVDETVDYVEVLTAEYNNLLKP